MARSAQPILDQPFPEPYPQEEADSPAFSCRGRGFTRPGPVMPDTKGNLGFLMLKPSDAFAENPDPNYRPYVITRR